MEILRRCLKQIRDEDIEVFLHYCPDVAIQIVNDLIDKPATNNLHAPSNGPYGSNSGGGLAAAASSLSNAIDKETKGLAMRIKKCAHYKSYQRYLQSIGGSFKSNYHN